MAKLYFSYSTMNAGKSTLLLQASYNYRERGMRTLLFTSSLYAEGDTGLIASRIGISAPAELYGDNDDLFDHIRLAMDESKLDCVFVDEAQFLTPEQVWQLARVADRLRVPVMCFGLRTDFRGQLFPGSAELLAVADVLREIRTICYCGAKATMVVRKGADGRVLTAGEQVSIEKSVYVSLAAGTGKKRPAAGRQRAPLMTAEASTEPAGAEPAGALTIRTLAMPADTNPAGDIFGGWVMSQMDIAGAIAAVEQAKGRVATVAVEAMTFIAPVKVGDILCVYTHLERIGTTSITIAIEAWARRDRLGDRVKVTDGRFVYVALGEDGRKRAIPR